MSPKLNATFPFVYQRKPATATGDNFSKLFYLLCKDKNFIFPLERKKIKEKEDLEVNSVVDLYVFQGLSIDAIYKKTGICRDFIRGVINGTYACMKDKNYNYPLVRGSKKV